jgi:deoxyribonuclease-4
LSVPSRGPLIGAHCPGGIRQALAHASEIGAECLQVFASAPQMWRAPKHKDEDVNAFVDGCRAAKLGPVFLHSVYLLNLASPLEPNVAKSVQSIRDHLHWADRFCAEGLVIHVGSAGKEAYDLAEDRVVAALAGMLDGLPGQSKLLLETCAGQGATIGRTFDELGRIIKRLDDHPRLGICLDTCHIFAAGYAIQEADGVARMLDDVERTVGLARLACIHANDSKGAFGSNVDRHENIGLGHLGDETFAHLLARPELRNVPFILEVPGIEGTGPDRPNVEVLKRLRDEGLAVARPRPDMPVKSPKQVGLDL